MRRADIARCSAVTGGADYISTLPRPKGEGSACCGVHRFAPVEQDHHLGLAASVVTGSFAECCMKPWSALPTDFPRYYPTHCVIGRTGVGSTVISRFMTGISAGPPQMLLRCQTLPSMWTLGKDKPVIPGVPFIR